MSSAAKINAMHLLKNWSKQSKNGGLIIKMCIQTCTIGCVSKKQRYVVHQIISVRIVMNALSAMEMVHAREMAHERGMANVRAIQATVENLATSVR